MTDAFTVSDPSAAVSGGGAAIVQREIGNALLQHMSEEDFARLQPNLRRVPLQVAADLASAGQPLTHVYFMEGAVAGFLDVLGDGRQLTIGLVGREGCVGWPLVMGYRHWPYSVAVRGEDTTALRIEADHLLAATAASPTLHAVLLRFAGVFAAQMGRTISTLR